MCGRVSGRRAETGPMARLYAALAFAAIPQPGILNSPVFVEQFLAVSTSVPVSLQSGGGTKACSTIQQLEVKVDDGGFLATRSSLPLVDSSIDDCVPYTKPRSEPDAANSPQNSSLTDFKWQKYLRVAMDEFEASSAIDWDDLLNWKSDCMNDDDANDAPFVVLLSAWTLNC